MEKIIHIVDTETTGLKGYPDEYVVEIAICEYNIDKDKIKQVFESYVGIPDEKLNREAWIFKNTSLKPETIIDCFSKGITAESVATKVRNILRNKRITCFNTDYDLDKLLYHKPWNLKDITTRMPCIMKTSTKACKILKPRWTGYKWPKLSEAIRILDIKGEFNYHTAMGDTLAATRVLKSLIKKDQYPCKW